MTTTTYHVSVERQARVDFIIDVFGGCFGQDIISCIVTNNLGTCKMTLTSKGIIYLQSIETDKIITMYIATVSQAVFLFNENFRKNGGQSKIPKGLMNQVKKNQKLLTQEYFML